MLTTISSILSLLTALHQTEQDRLDMQHAGFEILLGGKLFLPPLTEVPSLVLDVATGTGIWALEFGQLVPRWSLFRLILTLLS
jgi:ubiquinone/menaquinone biosynthesis C-methylase UbiE